MKYQVDVKSILIGFLSAALLIGAFSFKEETSQKEGRYQTSVAESRVVILDTKTGAYIMSMNLSNYNWQKGDFSTTYSVSKGK
jgi:hypothetical protein